MKVDPNLAVGRRPEFVLCEAGRVETYDGSGTPQSALTDEDSAFARFCRSLDPNTVFLIGLLPNDPADRPLFFAAKEAAGQLGVHMQGDIYTEQQARAIWQQYKTMKSTPGAEEP